MALYFRPAKAGGEHPRSKLLNRERGVIQRRLFEKDRVVAIPTYTYKCYYCGLLTEQRQSVAERNRPIDCECGQPAGRVFAPTANLLVPEHFRHTASDFLPEKGDAAWANMGRDSSQTHARPARTLKEFVGG